MKRIVTLLSVALSFGLQAQLTVLEGGQTLLGNLDETSVPATPSTLNICDRLLETSGGVMKKDIGSISLGKGRVAVISGGEGGLTLQSPQSFSLMLGSSLVNSALSASSSNRTFNFSYDVKAPSFLTTSDARLKQNVESLSEVIKSLADITPVSYNLTEPAEKESSGTMEKDSKLEEKAQTDRRVHFGFIAQEVQNIYPNLVVEDEEGMLSLDYVGFIPLLVGAYKELSLRVREQEEIISQLTGSNPSMQPSGVNPLVNETSVLKQNKPNPFNMTTCIECTLPSKISVAFLLIYDLQGKQLKRIDIRERGNVSTMLEASSFSPGMYIYSLIADGVEVDSKRMIITD